MKSGVLEYRLEIRSLGFQSLHREDVLSGYVTPQLCLIEVTKITGTLSDFIQPQPELPHYSTYPRSARRS